MFVQFEIGYFVIYLNYIFQMKPSEFKISVLLDSYNKKYAENYQNCNVVAAAVPAALPVYCSLVIYFFA